MVYCPCFSMEAPSPKWTEAELRTDAVSKKQIAEFLQANASYDFLRPRQLIGKIGTRMSLKIIKKKKKCLLCSKRSEGKFQGGLDQGIPGSVRNEGVHAVNLVLFRFFFFVSF